MRLAVCFIWISLAGCTVVPQQDCPSSQCTCEGEVIKCICTTRETITLSTILNFDVKAIEIRHCGTVTVSSMAFIHLHLNSIVFNDLLVLKIRPIAFYGGVMSHLEISNIEDLQASSYGLNGLANMSMVEFSNVTAEVIPHTFLVGSDIRQVLIRNCNLQDVGYQAFSFTNTTNLVVSNCRMDTLRSKAFTTTGNSELVVFEKNSFKLTENASFVIESQKLVFQDCFFEELYTEVFHADYVDTFIFDGNTIALARNEAFLYLNPNGTIHFTNNHIHFAEENALTLFLSPSISGDIKNNTFNCHCSVDWFWQPSYYHIRETSLCFVHGELIKAKEIELAYDEEGRCIELMHVNATDSSIEYNPHQSLNSTWKNLSSQAMLDLLLALLTVTLYFYNELNNFRTLL